MFTGLVESTGTLVSLIPSRTASGPMRITISSPSMAPRLRTGDSIAVSGVCLTALDITPAQFSADLAEETVRRTTLARLEPGGVVNLELPTPAGTPLGGHVVQGHVDGIGTLLALDPIDPADEAHSDWRLRLTLPPNLSRYVVPQGSITVEGISLTVASVSGDEVGIAIIPHTYAATALHTLKPGTPVNIEVDVLAKYAERKSAASQSAWTLTEDYLLSNGY
jgi:riboflavin synthase